MTVANDDPTKRATKKKEKGESVKSVEARGVREGRG